MMGFFDSLFKTSTTPKVETVLPEAALLDIKSGRLPTITTNRIFLENGEVCHYADNAIFQKVRKVRVSTRSRSGYRMPGLFSGTSFLIGGGKGESTSRDEYDMINGTLFITNKRILFSASNEGFVHPLSRIIAINPFANAVEIQLQNDKSFTVFVPDGSVVSSVLHMVK